LSLFFFVIKGVTLARPEVVPFRLTSHMVDGMGVSGCEGIFRKVMEVVCGVLRDNQETLCSVLEPFLQDPTVGWDRTGRAQKDDANQRYRLLNRCCCCLLLLLLLLLMLSFVVGVGADAAAVPLLSLVLVLVGQKP